MGLFQMLGRCAFCPKMFQTYNRQASWLSQPTPRNFQPPLMVPENPNTLSNHIFILQHLIQRLCEVSNQSFKKGKLFVQILAGNIPMEISSETCQINNLIILPSSLKEEAQKTVAIQHWQCLWIRPWEKNYVASVENVSKGLKKDFENRQRRSVFMTSQRSRGRDQCRFSSKSNQFSASHNLRPQG